MKPSFPHYKRLLLALLLLFPVASAGEYVTDKLVAGLYGEPDASGTPLRALPTGTPLEVLDRRGQFTKVRAGDGLEGWIDRNYLTREKPAGTMLLELHAATSDLKEKLRQTEISLEAARQTLLTKRDHRGRAATPKADNESSDRPAYMSISKYLLITIAFSLMGFFVGRYFGRR